MNREKIFRNINDQIKIQKDRNLKIHNEIKMRKFIEQKNYFNSINGFETLFLESSNPKKYMSRTSFKDIERMYWLDRNIAKCLFQEIEKIEIELKSRISYEFSKVYCNNGIESNLEYLKKENYEIPNRQSRNHFSKYFYTYGCPKKTHIFFNKHKIYAKLKNVSFTGIINRDENNTYYSLSGTFIGYVDNLKANIYQGTFCIENRNIPEYISNIVSTNTVTINNISNLPGKFSNLSYSDFCKIKYPHIASYKNPPLWVVIDTLTLGQTLILFQGLNNNIQKYIIKKMGFDPSISGSREKFINACEILNELRNRLAHFGLITRYRTGYKISINNIFISELSLTPKTTNRILKFYQSLKILNSFKNFSITKIDNYIRLYYLKNILLFKFNINKKFFERIGK